MNTCFLGHRDAPDSILPSLSAAIEARITKDGVEQFVAGAYVPFTFRVAKRLFYKSFAIRQQSRLIKKLLQAKVHTITVN